MERGQGANGLLKLGMENGEQNGNMEWKEMKNNKGKLKA